MKKVIAIAITFVLMLGCVFMSACSEKSNAVTRDELIRENFAAGKEAEDDAKGREHIEIPENTETIEIEGEEWKILRSIEEFEEKIFYSDGGLEKNYILANDIDLKRWRNIRYTIFQGKINGNNYKFYSSKETGGFGSCLFYNIKNAILENIIFSASDGYFWGG